MSIYRVAVLPLKISVDVKTRHTAHGISVVIDVNYNNTSDVNCYDNSYVNYNNSSLIALILCVMR